MRSPHAHARLRSIDITAAKSAPGVLGVFTGKDMASVGGLPCGWQINNIDGTPMKEPKHAVLAENKVCYVGDHVALVVAETLAQAKDAANLIDVDYDVLPAVADTATAAKSKTAVHDIAPDNVCFTWGCGDKTATDAAFAKAAHVTKLQFTNNRLIPNAIEPRAANAAYSRGDDSYTLYVSNQNPHVERLLMTAFVLGLPEHKVRVVSPDVGGGFGSKIYLYAEETALVWASKHVGRPIKWTAERSEAFLSDAHGRDHVTSAELALDKDGKFLALRVYTTANMGAYLSTLRRVFQPFFMRRCSPANTQHRRSIARCRRCSPTPRRSMRIVVPAGPRRPTSSSASSKPRRANEDRPGRTAPPQLHSLISVRIAGWTDVRRRRLRGDAETRDRTCRRQGFRRAQPTAASAACCAALATPTSRRAGSRHQTSPARSAHARACSKRAKCACIRPAR